MAYAGHCLRLGDHLLLIVPLVVETRTPFASRRLGERPRGLPYLLFGYSLTNAIFSAFCGVLEHYAALLPHGGVVLEGQISHIDGSSSLHSQLVPGIRRRGISTGVVKRFAHPAAHVSLRCVVLGGLIAWSQHGALNCPEPSLRFRMCAARRLRQSLFDILERREGDLSASCAQLSAFAGQPVEGDAIGMFACWRGECRHLKQGRAFGGEQVRSSGQAAIVARCAQEASTASCPSSSSSPFCSAPRRAAGLATSWEPGGPWPFQAGATCTCTHMYDCATRSEITGLRLAVFSCSRRVGDVKPRLPYDCVAAGLQYYLSLSLFSFLLPFTTGVIL